VRAYNETVGSYEARVLPGARKFAEHGATAGRELPELEQVTLSARTVHIAELTELAELDGDEDEVAARRLRAAD
jgi:DNA recombination protein RmuC